MKIPKVITLAVSMLLVTLSVSAAQAQNIQWRDIIGIIEAANLVGSGTGTVLGGAPWSTLGGGAKVNLDNGSLQFQVKGLVLAVGSAPAFNIPSLPIGTPDGVTDVMGTLVCDLDGSAGGGNSVLVDSASVPLSATGNAQFSGSVGTIPAVCATEPDIAFLIRIFNPAEFRGIWIANGAVLAR